MSRGELGDDAASTPMEAALAALCEPRLTVTATTGLDEAVSTLAWSPAGLGLAAGTLGGEVAQWMPGVAAPLVHDCGSPVLDVAWSPDGEVLAGACEDGTLWWWAAGEAPVPHRVGGTAGALAWGADGLAVAAEDTVVVLADDGRRRCDLTVPPGAAMVVAWTSPGAGAALLVGGVGGLREVLIDEVEAESWPLAAVIALAVDPRSGLAAAGTLGGGVEIGRRGPTLQAGRDAVSTVAWSAEGSLLAAVADGGL
ncbi:MAG TPA: hypothetical protein VNT52_16220, partial [Acidimicrobiales bacterium]|nr:hypothetical protein [Acidimicrobiales bacterium]